MSQGYKHPPAQVKSRGHSPGRQLAEQAKDCPAKVITQSSHEGKQFPVLENVPISGLLAQWARPGEDAAARDKQRMQLDQWGMQ